MDETEVINTVESLLLAGDSNGAADYLRDKIGGEVIIALFIRVMQRQLGVPVQ